VILIIRLFKILIIFGHAKSAGRSFPRTGACGRQKTNFFDMLKRRPSFAAGRRFSNILFYGIIALRGFYAKHDPRDWRHCLMKKIFAVTVAVVLIFVFAACKQDASPAGDSAQTEAPAQAELPNPVVEVNGSADFEPLGFTITAPQGSENASYSIISDSIAQIDFTLDGRAYTYRAGQTDEDISGVYETFDETEQSIDLEAEDFLVSVRLRTIGGGDSGALATWSLGGVTYSMYSPDASDFDSISDAALLAAYADLPFAACSDY